MAASDVLARLESLKKAHVTASQARAVAENHFTQAQETIAKAEAQLRELGIDPARAEEQLVEELTTLDKEIAARSAQLEQCMKDYQAIGDAFRAIGV